MSHLFRLWLRLAVLGKGRNFDKIDRWIGLEEGFTESLYPVIVSSALEEGYSDPKKYYQAIGYW
jgi:hypothetical protein